MILDPTTVWLYRGVLVAVGLACLALTIYALSKAGSVAGVQGLDGIFGWLSGWKTYLIASAAPVVVALNAYEYISDRTMGLILVLLGSGGLATLRAGQAQAEKKAETAVVAAKVSAVKVEQAVATVIAKTDPATVTPKRVDASSPTPTPKDSS